MPIQTYIHHCRSFWRYATGKRLWLLGVLWLPMALHAEVLLLTNPSLSNEDLSKETLVRIFAMQKRVWSDGTPVKAFVLPNKNDSHKQFVNGYLHMQPYQLDRLWHRLVFSGTGSTPEVAESAQQMIEKVRTTPGAIGYIDADYKRQVGDLMISGGAND